MRFNGLQMVQFECPRHWDPSVSSNFEVRWIPFSHYWPSGVIEMGSPVWKWKLWKIMGTKLAQGAENGSIVMPLALETLCLVQFWVWKNSLFPLLALWGNKKWLPSMTVKKMENFLNKRAWMGCKWSSLNAPGIEIPLYHPILQLGEFHFFPLLALWVLTILHFQSRGV